MSSFNPTDAARFNLFNVLIGIALTFAVEILLKENKNFSIASIHTINTLSFLLLTVLFYHGKIATTESSNHLASLTGRPTMALIDYMLHFLVVITIVVGAFLLKDMTSYTQFNLWLRSLDFVLTLFLSVFISPYSSKLELRAQISWLAFNAIAAMIYAYILFNYQRSAAALGNLVTKVLPTNVPQATESAYTLQAGELTLAILFLLIVIIDVLMDSTLNRRYYAGAR